jgi:hypothetical protein
MLAHLFKIEPLAATDREIRKWINTSGGGLFVDPVCGNVKGDRQFLDGQGAAVAVRYWAQWSPGHGLEFERLAAQHRAKSPGGAEEMVIGYKFSFLSQNGMAIALHQNHDRKIFI